MVFPLVQLQQAVLNDDRVNIDAYFAALDQISANKYLEAVAENYGFKTFWSPDAFDGWRVMLGQDLADVMYGTRDPRSLGQLLRRYSLDFIDIRASQYNTATLKVHFGLARTVSQASFATWKHFLVAGMNGATSHARKVGVYLLAMETSGRVQEEMQAQRPGTALERLKQSVLDRANDLTDVVLVHDEHLIEHDGRFIEHDGRLNDHDGRLKALVIDIHEARLRHEKAHARKSKTSSLRQKFPRYVINSFLTILCQYGQQDCMWPGCTQTQIITRRMETFDHVLAPKHGGTNDIRNIGLLCGDHNRLKSDDYVQDYRPVWLVEALHKRFNKWAEEDAEQKARGERCLYCGVPGCRADCYLDTER